MRGDPNGIIIIIVLAGFAASYTNFQIKRRARHEKRTSRISDAVLAYRRLRYRIELWKFNRRQS